MIAPPQLRKRAHFRSDDKAFHPARRSAQMGIMQNKAPIAPLIGASIDHIIPAARKLRGAGGSKKGIDLAGGGGRAIGAARAPRRNAARNAPAPGQSGLVWRIGIRVWQAIARQLLHQNKGVKRHLLPSCVQRADRLDHGLIGGRSAINRAAIQFWNFLRLRARKPADAPRHFQPVMGFLFDFGAHSAMPAAQIIAKPRHHQRHRPCAGQFGPQIGQ